jgi:phosphomannomutase
LSDLIQKIRDNKLDGGIAFDGDGDRAFLVDETGAVLTGGVMSAMMAEHFLQVHPGANIAYDARNSRSVPNTIRQHGGTPVITKVGHANIKHTMREHDAPFGGEASGHFYFRDNWYADSGLIGAVIGLYVATLSGKKLSELREKYSHYAAIPETNFKVDDTKETISRILNAYSGHQVDDLDGITIALDDSTWFNVRSSNTEPVLRLNAEAKDESTLNTLVNKLTSIIEEGKL